MKNKKDMRLPIDG